MVAIMIFFNIYQFRLDSNPMEMNEIQRGNSGWIPIQWKRMWL
jgi:hypothetical protein